MQFAYFVILPVVVWFIYRLFCSEPTRISDNIQKKRWDHVLDNVRCGAELNYEFKSKGNILKNTPLTAVIRVHTNTDADAKIREILYTIIREMLEQGADPNKVTTGVLKTSPLIATDDLDVTRLLFDHGAKPCKRAFSRHVSNYRVDQVAAFLENGADPNDIDIINTLHQFFMVKMDDKIRRRLHRQIIEMLLEAGYTRKPFPPPQWIQVPTDKAPVVPRMGSLLEDGIDIGASDYVRSLKGHVLQSLWKTPGGTKGLPKGLLFRAQSEPTLSL